MGLVGAAIKFLGKGAKAGKGAKGVVNASRKGMLGKGMKLGGAGAVAGATMYGAKKAFDLISDALGGLMGGKDSKGSNIVSNRSKKSKETQTSESRPISQNITFKKHDYPNTYRVQLNQLSNSINYIEKQDKISKRKTDNKYQSILCKKILNKLTLHTEVQNDLIVNEINNILGSNSDINEKTKKAFIGNILDLITPKNKGNLSDTFANANTLKELKSITKTQIKIYSTLKNLSDISLKGIKERKKEHVYSPIVKSKSKGGASYVSNGGGHSLLNGLLSALLGGALFTMLNPFGDSESKDSKEPYEKGSDPIKDFVNEASMWFRASITKNVRANWKKMGTNVDDLKKFVKESKTQFSKIQNTKQNIHNVETKVQNDKIKLNNTQDPALRKKLEDTIKKNEKFIAFAKKMLAGRSSMAVIKVLKAIKSAIGTVTLGASNAFLIGIEALLLDYQLEHLDEILGRPATDEDRIFLTTVTVVENVPVVGFIVAMFDLLPSLLNLAGIIIEEFIVPALEYLVKLYEKGTSNPIIRDILSSPFGESIKYVLDFAMINVKGVIKILKSIGGLLSAIDPNFLINSLNAAYRFTYETAEKFHVHSNHVIDILKDKDVISRKDFFSTGGIGDYEIADVEALKGYSLSDLSILHDWEGLNYSSKVALENIINEKKREIEARLKSIANAKDNDEKSWAIVNANIDSKIEHGKKTATDIIGALSDPIYDEKMNFHTRKFFDSWKYYVEKVKDGVEKTKREWDYVLPPPLCVFMQFASDIGGKGIYYIFFYGTVAVLKDESKDALYNNNLQAIAILNKNCTFEFSDKPSNDDKECYEHYNSNSPISWHDYKVKEYEKELAKLSEIPDDYENTSYTSALTSKTYSTSEEATKYAPTVGSVKYEGVDTANIFSNVDVNDTSSGLSYLKSQFTTLGINILFILENEMYGSYFKLLINNKLSKSEEMPVTCWESSCQTDFMGNCNRGGFFNKKPSFMPHPKMMGKKYRFKSGSGMYTYFSQSVDCSVAWFNENLNILKKYFDINALNFQFKTVIADIMYHAGAGRFGTKGYAPLCNALNNKNFLTARNLIATCIDQTDRGKPIAGRVSRRVALIDTCNPKDNDTGETVSTSPVNDTGGNAPQADASKATSTSTEVLDSALTSENLKTGTVTESASSELTSENLKYGSSSPVPVETSTGTSSAPTPEPVNETTEDKSKVIRAADNATRCAKGGSTGYCARHVSDAMQNAGFKFNRPRYAFMYHTDGILSKLGFGVVHSGTSGYNAQKGDICVVNAFDSKKRYDKKREEWDHQYGHVCIYNGKQWVSDWRQKSPLGWNIYKDKSVPNRGVYYYRLGSGSSVPAEPDPSAQTNMDDYSQSTASSSSATGTQSQQTQQSTAQQMPSEATAKANTSDADARSAEFDKTMTKMSQEEIKKYKKENVDNKQTVKEHLDMTSKIKSNSMSDIKNLKNANSLFISSVIDYNEIIWYVEKY